MRNPWYIFLFFIWDLHTCATNDATSLANDCQCDSSLNTHDCFTDEFCWDDNTCHEFAKCVPHDTNVITTNNCQCSLLSSYSNYNDCETNGHCCAVNQYCIVENSENVCKNYRNFFQINSSFVSELIVHWLNKTYYHGIYKEVKV